jgi:hypothetical protein
MEPLQWRDLEPGEEKLAYRFVHTADREDVHLADDFRSDREAGLEPLDERERAIPELQDGMSAGRTYDNLGGPPVARGRCGRCIPGGGGMTKMFWALYDSEGRRHGSFEEESAAREALIETVRARPALESELVLLAYDDDGEPIGDGVMFEDLLPPTAPNGMPTVWAGFAFSDEPVVAGRVDAPPLTPA